MISKFISGSSLIDSVGYDNFKLLIRFKNQKAYIYYNVPYSLYEELVNSSSPGSIYNKKIKGKFKSTKISF